jgi:hypothetical protein
LGVIGDVFDKCGSPVIKCDFLHSKGLANLFEVLGHLPTFTTAHRVLVYPCLAFDDESAESAIGFGRRLQRREFAGLRSMGPFSIPTAPTKTTTIQNT